MNCLGASYSRTTNLTQLITQKMLGNYYLGSWASMGSVINLVQLLKLGLKR
jgi:hypothetical protein